MNLLILMLERTGLIILLAYLLVHIPTIRQKVQSPYSPQSQLVLWALFSLFAVLANYTGVEIQSDFSIVNQAFSPIQAQSSLANTRVLAISVAGLVAGPYVALGVGLVSAMVRFFQGGVAPYVYVISSLVVGIGSGQIGRALHNKGQGVSVIQAAFTGLVLEGLQMACILALSPDKNQALHLVSLIALPMMVANSMGTAIFISILNSTQQMEENTRAMQTHDVLDLANKTLPYLRQGLTHASCQPVAQIIHQTMNVAAVSLTNEEEILAFVGQGHDHHVPHGKILTQLAKSAIQTGEIQIAHIREEIDCDHQDCPLQSAIVIPLKVNGQTLGTLKLYFSKDHPMTHVAQQLATGLGNVFSTQLALGQAEQAARLLQDSEIKSLQAQVNPHFLFNALNTISALIRMDADKARALVQDFARFLRGNLQGARVNLIPLKEELAQVEAYLALENARFPDKVRLIREIDQTALDLLVVPPFSLQILVENAYKHAFKEKSGNELRIRIEEQDQAYVLEVQDNGLGIDPQKLALLGKKQVASNHGTGSALENLAKRLTLLYGNEAQLSFQSSIQGTKVRLILPLSSTQNPERI